MAHLSRSTTAETLRTAARRHAFLTAVVLTVALGLLAACGPGGSPAASATSTGATMGTATGVGTASVNASTTSTGATPSSHQPSATATPASGTLQATLSEQFFADYCSSSTGEPSGSICFSGAGHGQMEPLGNVTFSRTAVYLPGGSDSCGPARTQGTLKVASGDTISFSATGTFCRATETATYTYTITGGTGAYKGASGKGTIQVPAPQTNTSETQTWSGTFNG